MDNKSALESTMITYIAQLVTFVFDFISFAIISTVLSINDYSIFGTGLIIKNFFSILFVYGNGTLIQEKIPKISNLSVFIELKYYLRKSLEHLVIGSIIFFSLYWPFFSKDFSFYLYFAIFVTVLMISVLTLITSTLAATQRIDVQAKAFIIYSIIGNVVVVLWIVFNGPSLKSIFLSWAVGVTISFILIIYLYREPIYQRFAKMNIINVSDQKSESVIREGLKTRSSYYAFDLILFLQVWIESLILLIFFRNVQDFTVYFFVISIYNLSKLVWMPIRTVLLPIFSNLSSESPIMKSELTQQILTGLLFLLVNLTFILLFLGDIIFMLFPNFVQGHFIFELLISFLLIEGLIGVISVILISEGKVAKALRIRVIGILFNFSAVLLISQLTIYSAPIIAASGRIIMNLVILILFAVQILSLLSLRQFLINSTKLLAPEFAFGFILLKIPMLAAFDSFQKLVVNLLLFMIFSGVLLIWIKPFDKHVLSSILPSRQSSRLIISLICRDEHSTAKLDGLIQ